MVDEIKCDISGCNQLAHRIYYVIGAWNSSHIDTTKSDGSSIHIRCRDHTSGLLPGGMGTIREFDVETGLQWFSGMIAKEVHNS